MTMAMVDVDGSSLPADSQSKLFGLVWGLATIWRWVCIHQLKMAAKINWHRYGTLCVGLYPKLFSGRIEFHNELSTTTEGRFPDNEDLAGAADALLRLQDLYLLTTDQVASGQLHSDVLHPVPMRRKIYDTRCYRERKCTDTIGTVLVPRACHLQW